MRESFKLYGVEFKIKSNLTSTKKYTYENLNGSKNSRSRFLWIMTYHSVAKKWHLNRVEYIFIDRTVRPIRLRFNGLPEKEILALSNSKKVVQAKVKLYNSYDQTLS